MPACLYHGCYPFDKDRQYMCEKMEGSMATITYIINCFFNLDSLDNWHLDNFLLELKEKKFNVKKCIALLGQLQLKLK